MAGQAQTLLDGGQRGALLSVAQQDDGTYLQQVGGQVLIPGGAGNGQRLLAVVLGDRVPARLLEEVSRRGQRPGARQRRPLGGRRVQQRPQHIGSFGGVSADLPENPQGGGQPQARLGVGLGQADGGRGPQIAQLGIEPVQPGALIGGHQVRRGRLGQGQVVIAMGGPGGPGRRRAQRGQPGGRVLPDGLQQPVPARAGTGVTELDQALVHQRTQMTQHLPGRHIRARGDRLGAGQAEPPSEGRQPGQHRPLGAGQQLPRPVHHGPQRLLPRQPGPRPAGQQREPLIEPGLQLARRHDPQPGRGQLDRQRDPIQPPADPPGHRGGLLVPGQRHPLRGGPVRQQPHRLAGQDRPGVSAVARSAHGRHPVDALSADAERLAAGGQQRQVRAAPQQRVGQLRARADHVLTVVQQYQQDSPAHRIHQRVQHRTARLLPHPQHVSHRHRDQIRVTQRGKIREPYPVPGAIQQPGRHLQSEPGLARPACAGQRDQPRLGHPAAHRG